MESKELINKIKSIDDEKHQPGGFSHSHAWRSKTINTIETGKYTPSTVLALRIARYFKAPVESIFQLNKEEEITTNK